MKPARNGEKIAKAALELFCAVGFKAASIRGIAQRSGVSVGNLYNHVSSKEALFERLFAERFPGTHIERMFLGADPDAGLDGILETVLGNMFRYAEADPYFFRLVMIDLNEFGGDHLRRYSEPYDKPLEELLSGIPSGEGIRGVLAGLRSDIEGSDITRLFLWLFYAMGFTSTMKQIMTEKGQDDVLFRTLLAVVKRGLMTSRRTRE